MQKSTSPIRSNSRAVLSVALLTTLAAPSIVAPVLTSSAAQAQLGSANYNAIRVFINGREVSFGGVAPVQESGRTLVPMRAVFEALGAFVDFNPATQVITGTRGATRVQLTLGSQQAYVNNQPRILDVPARTVQGRTLVPFRFAAESFGATVDWNPNTRIINISTSASDPNSNPDDVDVTPTEVLGNVSRYDNTTNTISLRSAIPGAQIRTYVLSPNARFYRRTTGRILRGTTPAYSAPVLATEAALSQGADVSLQLNSRNEVTRVTVLTSVIPARIRDVQGDQITLDDGRDTILTPGPNLRVYDTRGREITDASTLVPGQRVALFITPSTRRPFAVSASTADVRLADDVVAGAVNDGDIDNDDNTDVSGTPQINLVQHNATRALRAGQTLSVTVRGTSGMRGTFSVIPDVPETDLIEDRSRPGVYTGSYLVQSGDNVYNGRVSATLRATNGREAFQQSQSAVTIDTIAPRITGTAPANGANVNNSQPTIVINANDTGGSGLGSATVTINGIVVPTEDITISSNAVTIVNPDFQSGQVDIVATVFDRAGNQARRSFSFSSDGRGSGTNDGDDIISFSSNATSDVQFGDRVTVDLRAGIGGNAFVDVLGSDRRTVRQTVRLTEISDGRYRATFSVPDTSDTVLYLQGRYTSPNGMTSTREASAPLYIGNSGGLNQIVDQVTITSPRSNATVANSIVVEGRAEPNSTIDVNVVAQGTRYLLFEYSNDLGTQQVQADSSGNWRTPSITLPRPNNVSNLSYVISATQTDSTNNRSEPVTVTVTPQ